MKLCRNASEGTDVKFVAWVSHFFARSQSTNRLSFGEKTVCLHCLCIAKHWRRHDTPSNREKLSLYITVKKVYFRNDTVRVDRLFLDKCIVCWWNVLYKNVSCYYCPDLNDNTCSMQNTLYICNEGIYVSLFISKRKWDWGEDLIYRVYTFLNTKSDNARFG